MSVPVARDQGDKGVQPPHGQTPAFRNAKQIRKTATLRREDNNQSRGTWDLNSGPPRIDYRLRQRGRRALLHEHAATGPASRSRPARDESESPHRCLHWRSRSGAEHLAMAIRCRSFDQHVDDPAPRLLPHRGIT